ncbi:MAG: hypothetical protein RL571_2161 [Pseudomonadota bacterium]|jgi:GntR family transcriptional regulator/MocR family aminotransferase
MQTVTTYFMTQGHFAAHLRQMRTLYRKRRDLLLEGLKPLSEVLSPINTGAGLQFSVCLATGLEPAWTTAGSAAGLALRPLSSFYLGEPKIECWLMGYAALSNTQIRSASQALMDSFYTLQR